MRMGWPGCALRLSRSQPVLAKLLTQPRRSRSALKYFCVAVAATRTVVVVSGANCGVRLRAGVVYSADLDLVRQSVGGEADSASLKKPRGEAGPGGICKSLGR